MKFLSGIPRAILCVGLAAVAPGCVGAPPAPARPAPAHVAGPSRPAARARAPKCEQAARPPLNEAQKAELFEGFDDWQKERGGAAADAPVPPPAAPRRAASRACRVSGA